MVFMGYQTWGHASLQALLAADHSVPLVVTHGESSHPYETIWADSVAELAASAGIEVLTARVADAEVAAGIAAVEPDVILCSDWRTWVAPELLALARLGGINVHDGLLPAYGGFAPINWAIVCGESEAGVTAHVMTEELDGGDILVQRRVPIGFTDTATEVALRVFGLVGPVGLEALERIADPDFQPQPQDRDRATFFHKRSDRDSRIDWTSTPLAIYNLVRAQSDPYPNAHTVHYGRRLAIKRASLPRRVYCGSPGRVFCRVAEGVIVLCGTRPGNGAQGLVVESVQPEGGEEVPASEYFRLMGDDLG